MYTATGVYCLLRILLALIAAFNLKCYLVDVTNAFLNAVLDEEVYIKCPSGFEVCGYVWKLKQVLYGFCIAPKM